MIPGKEWEAGDLITDPTVLVRVGDDIRHAALILVVDLYDEAAIDLTADQADEIADQLKALAADWRAKQ